METITLSQKSWRDCSFSSQHHATIPTQQNGVHVILKGTLTLKRLKGECQTPWASKRLVLTLPLENALPKRKWLSIEQWAPQLTLNGLSNTEASKEFGFELRWTKLKSLINVPLNEVQIEAEVALKDKNSQIHQISYHIDLIGSLVEPP